MPGLTVRTPPPKAPHVVGPKNQKIRKPTVGIPQVLIDEARQTEPATWNPDEHLAYQPPANIVSMKDIGLEGHGISTTAVSDPFPLFTKEAIMQARREIFSDEVMKNCRVGSDFTANMVKGMGFERAPFTYSAWCDPQTVAKVSEVAGIELVPALDCEIAQINISVNEQNQEYTGMEESSTVAWHYDSFPFVCVTMASDCTDMVGGETAIELPNGEIRKVRGPAMGTAVVMQGRYIKHQALKAFGGRERIAMVTPFRPKSPFVRDETILTGSRPINHLDVLYEQYTEYRMEALEERFRAKLKEERRRMTMRKKFDLDEMRAFLEEQKEYIETTLEHIIHVE